MEFHQNFHVVVALHHFSPTCMTINHKVLYIYFMFQSNEMLKNQYFINILGNWPAATVKIIEKEPLWTYFD